MEKQKEYNLRYLLVKVRTTCGKASDRLRQRANKRNNKTVSDFFRHRSRTGKSYCRTRSDVGSETVNKKGEGIRLHRVFGVERARVLFDTQVKTTKKHSPVS
jgi:hypothetical protein